MSFEVDSKSGDVVDGHGAVGRCVQLSLIAAVCIALPVGIDHLYARTEDSPFDPGSEAYPAVLILMFGVPLFLFVWCFYHLRKGFRSLVMDPFSRTMHLTWQGLTGQWTESIPFKAIRGFSQKKVAISRYAHGWELRAKLLQGREIRLAKFYKEEAAIDGVKSANASLTTESPRNRVS